MQPCVGGERDVKRVLLLIKNDEDRERWLNQLSRITLAREDSQRPPSPLNSSKRGGSLRIRNRPGSVNRSPNLAAPNAPQRAMSIAVQRQTETQQAPRNYATYTGSVPKHRHPLPVELLRNSDWGDSHSQ